MAFSHRIWALWVGVGTFLGQMRAPCDSLRWVVVKGRPVFFIYLFAPPPPTSRGYITLITTAIIPAFWAAWPCSVFWALAYRTVIKKVSNFHGGSTSPYPLELKDERNEGQKGTQAKTYIKYKIVRALGVGE